MRLLISTKLFVINSSNKLVKYEIEVYAIEK